MSIFTRLFSIGQAQVNSVVDSMEDPSLMLDQAIREKDAQIREAKQALQGCIATSRQTESLMNRDQEEQASWERKAELAVKSGRDDLAGEALRRAEEAAHRAEGTRKNYLAQKASLDKLTADIRGMEDGQAELRRNKDFIIAQSKAAEAKKKISEVRARTSSTGQDVDDLIARMKAKAERSAFEADAAAEVADTFSGKDAVAKEFDQLETSSTAVQDKLAALKAKYARPVPALPG